MAMKPEPQKVIREYLRARGSATQKELQDLRVTFDVRKVISRLRRPPYNDNIITEYRPGIDKYATYRMLTEVKEQEKLF